MTDQGGTGAGQALGSYAKNKLGRRLLDGAVPPAPAEEHDHEGVHPQKQDGLFYAGFPVHLGLMDGATMLRLADLTESWGGEIRLTRRQNFILSHIPEARVAEVVREVADLGFVVGGRDPIVLNCCAHGIPPARWSARLVGMRVDCL